MLCNNREGRGVRERTLACLVVLPVVVLLMSAAMIFAGRTVLSETGIIEIASSHASEDFFEIYSHDVRDKIHDEAEFETLLDRIVAHEFPWQKELPNHRVRFIEEQSFDEQQASIYKKTYISSITRISMSFVLEQREIRLVEETIKRRAVFSRIAIASGVVLVLGILAVLFFVL